MRTVPAAITRRPEGVLEKKGPPPPQRVVARRNRRWLLLFLLSPVCLAIAVAFAYGVAGPPEPSVPARSVPPGFKAITDAYYGYSVPSSYAQNASWTDANGDWFYGTPQAFVAETMLITKHSPTAATSLPTAVQFDAESRHAVDWRLGAGQRIVVPHATFAYEVALTRPGGVRAVAVDTWLRDSSTQMWLIIHAPARVTSAVIASLQGS